jgi:hypothetical protein
VLIKKRKKKRSIHQPAGVPLEVTPTIIPEAGAITLLDGYRNYYVHCGGVPEEP